MYHHIIHIDNVNFFHCLSMCVCLHNFFQNILRQVSNLIITCKIDVKTNKNFKINIINKHLEQLLNFIHFHIDTESVRGLLLEENLI